MVCIIGPNGAGKSTLLRTLSGLNRPTRGSIHFKGQPVGGMKPYQMARSGLGHCPEGRRVFQHLSIEENLITGYVSGRGKTFHELRDEVFELFPILGERRNQSASRLSGGQQQMLAIGRALMGNPELLLLDEPSLGLAPIIIHQIFEIVLKLAESGVSIILVEQNIDLVVPGRGLCVRAGARLAAMLRPGREDGRERAHQGHFPPRPRRPFGVVTPRAASPTPPRLDCGCDV